jgi:RNA polymerase sigma-70 factor (ECF subfamily)
MNRGKSIPESRPSPGENALAGANSFVVLMEGLRLGEDAAAREVFQRFARQLLALARRRFDQRLASRVDPEDVVQSAFKSFFIRHREGKLRPVSWDGLWGLLTLITLRKCADRVEYFQAQCRDVKREVPGAEGGDGPWQPALNREPLPLEAAILAETVEHLFETVDTDERPVLELSLQGYTAEEICLRLGRALRTVQRLREQIRKRLERMKQEG